MGDLVSAPPDGETTEGQPNSNELTLTLFLVQQKNSDHIRRDIVKEKSATMEHFLETSDLDAATADMLKTYDQNGDGSFSKAKVVTIIQTLGASNKFFKRLLIASFICCALLLTSMFGLSYTVAAITASTKVQSDGTMLSSGGVSVSAPASAAVGRKLGDYEFATLCMCGYDNAKQECYSWQCDYEYSDNPDCPCPPEGMDPSDCNYGDGLGQTCCINEGDCEE
jgi:hypothetical protein